MFYIAKYEWLFYQDSFEHRVGDTNMSDANDTEYSTE